jgi:hypothetical protein
VTSSTPIGAPGTSEASQHREVAPPCNLPTVMSELPAAPFGRRLSLIELEGNSSSVYLHMQ